VKKYSTCRCDWGLPQYDGGLSEMMRNPRYATGVGLLLAGIDQQERHQPSKLSGSSLQQIFERMKGWFKNF
jgi:cell division protein FtsA